jgi:protein gp37
VSAGCKHCYAERFAERFRGVKGHPFEQGFDVRLVSEALNLPLHWRKPRKVFVNSMSDLFHPDVPDEFIRQVLDVTASAYWHQFLILTKRPDRMRRFSAGVKHWGKGALSVGAPMVGWPENVWIGVSIENQETADERIPILLDTPAAHRFVSAEPLLGPIDLLRPVWSLGPPTQAHGMHQGLDWVIVGGESGPGARPCDLEWIRSIVQQCNGAGGPCLVKQLGDRTQWNRWNPTDRIERDRNGRDPSEWPEDLRVQQFPEEMTCR